MNPALLRGLGNIISTFGTDFIDILKHGVFFTNLAGQNLGSIAMQMGTIMYEETGAFEMLKEIYTGFTHESTYHPKGLLAGGYHALLRKIENPSLLLEHCFDERLSLNAYKNIRPYKPNEQGGVIFDYYDPHSNTGHEIKLMEDFRSPDKVPYNEDVTFGRIRQIHKYSEWLRQNKNRKLEYHLIGHAHLDFLNILDRNTPANLKHRVKINLYSNLNLHTPVRCVFLEKFSARTLWDKYYNLDLNVNANEEIRKIEQEVISEINHTIEMVSYNTSWNYFDNTDVLESLKLLQATFVHYLSDSLSADFDRIMTAVISQWNDMKNEDLDPATLHLFNTYLIRLLASVEITLIRRNSTALFHLIGNARNLAFETRPYHSELEEYGIFFPLHGEYQRGLSSQPESTP